MSRIMVVEDNPKNLKLLRDVLQFWGYQVLVAGSGEEGVELAAHDPPDLILMDLQLPGIDGHEALRLLRQEPATRAVPVVAVTAFAMQDDRDQVAMSGFDGFLEKPLSVRDLPDQVKAFLEAREPS
jgi:two-component system cell cycle response regulator DivK